ncbi:LuxR C-terminal-related transcriptional regulator [soil metagenome]
MSDSTVLLVAAREAYRRRDWILARERFGTACEQAPLAADDLRALADCSWWLGDLDQALPAQQAAYRLYVDAGQPRPAAMMALETGYTLALRGEDAQASGWIGRAIRLLQDEPEAAEHGYLVYLDFEGALGAADLDAALAAALRVHSLGVRFGDPNLIAMGVLGQGRVLVKHGRVTEGMALLDEAMVAAVSDDLEPGWAGNIYCHLMLACHEIADLRRAGEWTRATARWCDSMPGAGPFMGICRVHRAQLLQVRGAWDEAEREVVRVCAELAHFHVSSVAEAHFQLGDLRRQRGDLPGAETAFRAAHGLGRDPQPGLALLRLAQGRAETAAASIRIALAAAAPDPLARARLLPAAVEIGIAIGDVERASDASAELAAIARSYDTGGLAAVASHARGAVLLAEGGAEQALQQLREALRLWQGLAAPYEAARVRVLMARACEALGDGDTATLERAAARAEFVRLGAPPYPGTAAPARGARTDGLTQR